MSKSKLTVSVLLSDTEFIDYCLNDGLPENKWKLHLQQYPDDLEIIEEAKHHVFLLSGELPDNVLEEKLNTFKKLFYQTKDSHLRTHSTRIHHLKPFYRIAIAASLLLLGGYFVFWPVSIQPKYTFAMIEGGVIETLPDAQKTILLKDGTEAVLYPGSSIVISKDFNEKDRKIAVRGQVHLKIFHQKEKPFIAYSKHITTTALGTVFYVRDFEKGRESSVLLVNGKVKVEEPQTHHKQFLDPGTSLLVNNKTLKSKKITFDKTELTELENHQLYFDNAEMSTVVRKLELFYGIEIDLSHCDCQFKRITGNYSRSSLSDILNTIAYINLLRWELSGQSIQFKPIIKP